MQSLSSAATQEPLLLLQRMEALANVLADWYNHLVASFPHLPKPPAPKNPQE